MSSSINNNNKNNMFGLFQKRLFINCFPFVAMGIINVALAFSADIVNLTDSNFDTIVLESTEPWLVDFFEPWSDSCKRLAPEWAKAATKLKGKIIFGAVDASNNPNKPSEYNVDDGSYPQIKYFPPGNKRKVNEYEPRKSEDYHGGNTTDEIISWALTKLFNDSLTLSTAHKKLVQAIMDDDFVDSCVKYRLCVVFFLPRRNACGLECRNSFLNILQSSQHSFVDNKGLTWTWAHAGDLYHTEVALEIRGAEFPLLAVVDPRKSKYDLLLPPFNQDEIRRFVTDLEKGAINTAHNIRQHAIFPKMGKDEL